MAWHCFRTLGVCVRILLLGLAIDSIQHHSSLQIIPWSCQIMWPKRQGYLHSLDVLYPFPALGPTQSWKSFMSPGSQIPPRSKEPTKHFAFLLVVENKKCNNLSRSLDSYKCYWYAKSPNIHKVPLSPFVVYVPNQVLQRIFHFIIIQSD